MKNHATLPVAVTLETGTVVVLVGISTAVFGVVVETEDVFVTFVVGKVVVLVFGAVVGLIFVTFVTVG